MVRVHKGYFGQYESSGGGFLPYPIQVDFNWTGLPFLDQTRLRRLFQNIDWAFFPALKVFCELVPPYQAVVSCDVARNFMSEAALFFAFLGMQLPRLQATMKTGWQEIDGNTYYFGHGVMQTGWQRIDGHRYYLGDDGIMRTGLQVIDGNTYYFGYRGIMRTGWQTVDGSTYYFGDDGIMQDGE